MLFNSYIFIFAFLPVAVLGFYLLGRHNQFLAVSWVVAASLFFYGWWNPAYLILIVASVCGNYVIGTLLLTRAGQIAGGYHRTLLAVGVTANLAVIGYYKYANFFLDNINAVFDTGFQIEQLLLPLGISFFTFQQVAFLVDCYTGKARSWRFMHYAFFVTFFPQLIAGPIVYHKEIQPQLQRSRFGIFKSSNIAVGLTIFIIGLTKKVILADNIAAYANPVFDSAAAGGDTALLDSWIAAVAYTLQLYFDFSGYSDMAIGLARLFGLKLPLNFDSPFKAASIIEFWNRWHMTLSRFINAYLFVPMATPLTRFSVMHRYPKWLDFALRIHIPLLVTFLLAGLWHGAGWTFVVFGLMHGIYLVVNHTWRAIRPKRKSAPGRAAWLQRQVSIVFTFVMVVLTFVPFRAADMAAAQSIWAGMFGLNGILLPGPYLDSFGSLGPNLAALGVKFGDFPYGLSEALPWLLLTLIIVWFLPNTDEIMRRYRPAINPRTRVARWPAFEWRMRFRDAVLVALFGTISFLSLTRVNEFLYFQF